MKKRHLLCALLLALVLSIAPNAVPLQSSLLPDNPVVAQAATSSPYSYATLSDGTLKITAYKGSAKSVTIPSKIGGKKVTVIGTSAFQANGTLQSVTIPDTVTAIKNSAFFHCDNLKTVTLGKNVVTIGKFAFENCWKLTTVTGTASSLKTIASYAFYNDEKLSKFPFGDSVRAVGKDAFTSTNLTISNDLSHVKTICENAFQSIKGFSGDLKITTENIGKDAFAYCNVKGSIIIADSVKNINNSWFNQTQTSKLVIGANLSGMSQDALKCLKAKSFEVSPQNTYLKVMDGQLYSASGKTLFKWQYLAIPEDEEGNPTSVPEDVTIPEGVKVIRHYAFTGNTTFGNIKLPSTLLTIGNGAFTGMDITKLSIPDSVTFLGAKAFSECYNLKAVKLGTGIKVIHGHTFEDCSALSKLNGSENVEQINAYAFSGCDSLKTLNLGANIKEINPSAFVYYYVKTINIPSTNKYYTIANQALVSKNKKNLIYVMAYNSTSYSIAKGITDIGTYAFADCYSLKKVTIPSTVKTIHSYAFVMNEDLKSLTIPSSVTTIGKYGVGYTGYYTSASLKEGFVIIGKYGTKANAYAKKNDIAFATTTPALNKTAVKLAGNKKVTLTVKGLDKSRVHYYTSNSKIATVSKKGVVTARKKGTTYIVVAEGSKYLTCKVTVTSNGKAAKTNFDYDNYTVVTSKNVNAWKKAYYKANGITKMKASENPNLVIYTGSEYIPIKATMKDGAALSQDNIDIYTTDLSRYKLIGKNISKEFKKYKLQQNTVLYSGTGYITCYTGTGNSLADMDKSVGKTGTLKNLVSTSLFSSVSLGFMKGIGTMLEFYAPKGKVKGAYIESISQFPEEMEYLIDQNFKYKILDAGVRIVKYDNQDSGKTELMPERYLKIAILG